MEGGQGGVSETIHSDSLVKGIVYLYKLNLLTVIARLCILVSEWCKLTLCMTLCVCNIHGFCFCAMYTGVKCSEDLQDYQSQTKGVIKLCLAVT